MTINYGRDPSPILDDDGKYPVIGTSDNERMGNGFLYDGESVVLGRKGTIDRVHFVSGRFWTIDTAYFLSKFNNALPKWLYYFLTSINFRSLNEATGVPSLSRDLLYTIKIPTPPKAEQTEIANFLSTVDRAIEQTEALIAKQQRIKTGLMQELLTLGIDEHGNLRSEQTHQFKDSPLGRIPVEWDVIRLDDILILKQYGISTSLTEEPTGVPVLRMNNLVEGEVSYSDLKYSTDPATVNLLLNDGDVLFNRTNSVDYVGRTAIYRQKGTPVSFASYLVRLVPNPTILLSEYLSLWLNDAANQIRVKQLATIGVQQANVNPTNLGTLEVAIPGSLEEQRLIVNAVFTCVVEISSIQKNLAKLRSLRTALMQDLLTGKRRVTSLSLSQLVSQAKDLSIWLNEKTNDRGISNDRRSQTGSSLLQLSLDIADAIIILLEKNFAENLPGPAWALARPLFESYVLGIWILKCASDEEVDQFLNIGRRPKFSKLLKAIDNKAKPQADWIRKTEGTNMRHFHDFTHGGIQHVRRRITENSVEPNYQERELEYLVGLGVEVSIRVGVEIFSLMNYRVGIMQLYEKAQVFPRKPLS